MMFTTMYKVKPIKRDELGWDTHSTCEGSKVPVGDTGSQVEFDETDKTICEKATSTSVAY